jgi:hypothetical protein
MYYAQVNAANICYSVVETSGALTQINCIMIDVYDESLLGKYFNAESGEFETPT